MSANIQQQSVLHASTADGCNSSEDSSNGSDGGGPGRPWGQTAACVSAIEALLILVLLGWASLCGIGPLRTPAKWEKAAHTAPGNFSGAAASGGNRSASSGSKEQMGTANIPFAVQAAALAQERAAVFDKEFAMLEEHTLRSRNHSDIPVTDSFVAAARTTLRGHHVLFVGDSVTRYQFLMLTALLYSGSWTWSGTPETNPRGWDLVKTVHQSSYGTWDEFYKVTTAIFEGAMECQDCFRKSTGTFDQRSTFERRIFDSAGIRLEFVQLFSSLGKDSIKFRMRQRFSKADVAMSLPAFLRWGVPGDVRSRPSAALLNFGWHRKGSEPWPVEEVAGLAFAEELRNTHLIWRRTTQGQHEKALDDAKMLDAIRRRGGGRWQILDARELSRKLTDNDRSLFIDNVHFWRPVYALLNIQLLQLLNSALWAEPAQGL